MSFEACRMIAFSVLNCRSNTECTLPSLNSLLIASMKAHFRMEWQSMRGNRLALIFLGRFPTVLCSSMCRYHTSVVFYFGSSIQLRFPVCVCVNDLPNLYCYTILLSWVLYMWYLLFNFVSCLILSVRKSFLLFLYAR